VKNNRYIDFFYSGEIKLELATKQLSFVPPSPRISIQASRGPILGKPTAAQNVLASFFIQDVRSDDLKAANSQSVTDKWGRVLQY
jgi:hypothetical protein